MNDVQLNAARKLGVRHPLMNRKDADDIKSGLVRIDDNEYYIMPNNDVLDYDKESAVFTDDLGNDEIQILANLMKLEWIRRCISTWDNIRQLYSDKDFSQANFLDKLNKTGEQVRDECRLMLDRYGRSTNYRPSKIFGKLAGK